MGAYLVKRYHHVDGFRQYDLRRQNLVPLYDEDPENPIKSAELDLPKSGDWLVEYDEINSRLSIMFVNKYVYLPRKHLYVKHFAKLKSSFEKPVGDEDLVFLEEVKKMGHLQAFPEEARQHLDRYQELYLLDFVAKMSKQRQRQANAQLKQFASERSSAARIAELVDPSSVTGAISKAALDAYMNRHSGKPPTKKEFEKLTKQFTSTSGRRKRRD